MTRRSFPIRRVWQIGTFPAVLPNPLPKAEFGPTSRFKRRLRIKATLEFKPAKCQRRSLELSLRLAITNQLKALCFKATRGTTCKTGPDKQLREKSTRRPRLAWLKRCARCSPSCPSNSWGTHCPNVVLTKVRSIFPASSRIFFWWNFPSRDEKRDKGWEGKSTWFTCSICNYKKGNVHRSIRASILSFLKVTFHLVNYHKNFSGKKIFFEILVYSESP